MMLTALFKKIEARDPTVFPAWEVLRIASIEGTRAVGLGDEVGSLEAGKQADLILVDMTELNLWPVHQACTRAACPQAACTQALPNRVYAGSGHEVKTVMVAGKVLVCDGEVLTADEGAIREEAYVQAEEVARRVIADPVHKEMALLEAMGKGWL